ncbi:MAG: hypothetical protein QOE28_1582 [Solirubrobacteraceae bacterium]|nr:hypothetical protein [Solirubrobacteraceae bacterium]
MSTTVQQPSSRVSTAGAGWHDCAGPGRWISDVPAGTRRLSWMRPATLWRSRNDIVAKHLYDPVDRARGEWVRMSRERAAREGEDPDFVVRRGRESDSVSFLLFGDPGEGDNSQYAVIPPLLSQAAGCEFAVICSDVIYPTGDMGDYRTKFFRPYRDLDMPLIGVPGNHDWYDGLRGFMHHLCGLNIPEAPLGVTPGWRGSAARMMWRRSARPTDDDLAHMASDRALESQRCDPIQPAPYWVVDAGPVRLVGIDTGIIGSIDGDQADWLRRVSLADDRPKLLITGKPLYVNNRIKAGAVVGRTETVNDIVTDPRANYIAAIGGDTHNYQRYPVTLPDGRTIQYVVSGGGGAYMHATHQITKIALAGVTEADFRCYPLRGDSLARFSQVYDHRLTGGSGRLVLEPDEAATYIAELLQLDTTRGTRVQLSPKARRAAHFLQPLPASHGFHRFASEMFDFDEPPFFKQFLRLDATPGELRIRCYGVTGCASTEDSPPVEDDFTIAL